MSFRLGGIMGDENVELIWYGFYLIKALVLLFVCLAVALVCKWLLRRIPWKSAKRRRSSTRSCILSAPCDLLRTSMLQRLWLSNDPPSQSLRSSKIEGSGLRAFKAQLEMRLSRQFTSRNVAHNTQLSTDQHYWQLRCSGQEAHLVWQLNCVEFCFPSISRIDVY
jgi:hypothetical protein